MRITLKNDIVMGKIKKYAKMKEYRGKIIETWGSKEKKLRRRNNIGQRKVNFRDLERIVMISSQHYFLISKEIARDCLMRHHKGP